MADWYILWQFGIFLWLFGRFARFGMLYQEKSGNPEIELNISFSGLLICARPGLTFLSFILHSQDPSQTSHFHRLVCQ
jgi:hypothetical protein